MNNWRATSRLRQTAGSEGYEGNVRYDFTRSNANSTRFTPHSAKRGKRNKQYGVQSNFGTIRPPTLNAFTQTRLVESIEV